MSIADEINAISDKALELEQDNERLREKNDQLRSKNEKLRLALEAKPAPSEAVIRLLDLLQEDIEWQERYRPDSAKLAPIIATYREIRPRGEDNR